MQLDGKVAQLVSERFAAGEIHMPFYSFVSCVTRLRKLFGNTHRCRHTHTHTHAHTHTHTHTKVKAKKNDQKSKNVCMSVLNYN